MKSISVFTRSYPGDKEFLPYLYKSLVKFFPEFREAVLIVEEPHFEEMLPFIPNFVKVFTEESFAPGTIQHKYSKLTADFYTTSDYVMHVDSDCIFTRVVEENLMFAANGRPYLEFAPYEHLHEYENSTDFMYIMKDYFRANVLPTEILKSQIAGGMTPEEAEAWVADQLPIWIIDNFESWFTEAYAYWKIHFGLCVWEQGTSFAMGRPVPNEYSRRAEKLYPRDVYQTARRHIEDVHRMSARDFIKTRTGKQSATARPTEYFSDLNFIGAVLDEFLHDRMEWIDISKINVFHRPPFLKQFISYDALLEGKLRSEVKQEISDILN
jgi:hypothetical protein